jgi:hypothetical protein
VREVFCAPPGRACGSLPAWAASIPFWASAGSGIPAARLGLGEDSADEMLVNPMNPSDLVRQLEALLISHDDRKRKSGPIASPFVV